MSEVVSLTQPAESVACIQMHDKEHKNTFTEALLTGLIESFKIVSEDKSYKAVILTGYDNYFASGGTQEGLIALHEGKGKFTDINVYSLALECPIPVISAMQGHGIGGGFAMGLFSDFIVLAREAIYTTNFMKYGFTPGMGATMIVPEKLGIALGTEMLMLAETYRGEHLQQRGVSFPVVPKAKVMEYASDLAKGLTEKPRESLVILKHHLSVGLKQRLPLIIEKELKMHEQTFHQDEVKELIKNRFIKR